VKGKLERSPSLATPKKALLEADVIPIVRSGLYENWLFLLKLAGSIALIRIIVKIIG
jgi:hypothetical protein